MQLRGGGVLLISIAAAATVCSAVAAYVSTGTEVGWFYMTVTLYHGGSCLAAAACRIAFDSSGSLLNQGTGNVSFVTLWERDESERGPGATLIFVSHDLDLRSCFDRTLPLADINRAT